MKIARRAALPFLPVLLAVVLSCSDDAAECDGSCANDPAAPVFAGAVSVAPDRTGTALRVTWAPGSDDRTQPAALRYRVYASTHDGEPTARPPIMTSEAGATSATIAVTPLGARHFIVVRAVDADGHEDGNRVEKSALAVPDTTAPSFAGLGTASPEPNDRITLSWSAATDDLTPPEGLRYEVYEAGPTGAPAIVALVEGATQTTIPLAGRAGEKRHFSVRAVDAAGNRDGNTVVVDRAVGPDVRKPTFAGCDALEFRGANTIGVSWKAASDETTPPAAIAYDIYVTSSGPLAFDKPPRASAVGKTSALISGLQPNTPYRFVCRARDAAGNRDDNTLEKAITTGDGEPPTFAGLTSATLDPALREVAITWDAGADTRTATNKLVYAAYQSTVAGVYDFTSPYAVSSPGATDIKLTGLPSATKLYWTVRARDEFANEDTNTVEANGTTLVSYAHDVAPLFARNCAVVGCHISANPTGGMSLSASVAYGNLVNVPAGEKPPGRPTPINRITPLDTTESYLYLKIMAVPGTFVGSAMPAPATGSVLSDADKALFRSWIEQGALQN